jgi:hypothetical protein
VAFLPKDAWHHIVATARTRDPVLANACAQPEQRQLSDGQLVGLPPDPKRRKVTAGSMTTQQGASASAVHAADNYPCAFPHMQPSRKFRTSATRICNDACVFLAITMIHIHAL